MLPQNNTTTTHGSLSRSGITTPSRTRTPHHGGRQLQETKKHGQGTKALANSPKPGALSSNTPACSTNVRRTRARSTNRSALMAPKRRTSKTDRYFKISSKRNTTRKLSLPTSTARPRTTVYPTNHACNAERSTYLYIAVERDLMGKGKKGWSAKE